jgi:hypothetical protein
VRAAAVARTTVAGPVLAGVLAAVLWIPSVLVADSARLGSPGLISVLPWWYFAGLALLVVALGWELFRPRLIVMCCLTVMLIAYLFGTVSAVEPIAGLPVAWYPTGPTGWITPHGSALPAVHARASWPGMFSLSAFIVEVTGPGYPSDVLRWAPPVLELLYLAPLRVIAQVVGVGARAGWLGTLLFLLSNWIERDHFLPQALNVLFYLVAVAAVLAFWRPLTDVNRTGPAVRRARDPGVPHRRGGGGWRRGQA